MSLIDRKSLIGRETPSGRRARSMTVGSPSRGSDSRPATIGARRATRKSAESSDEIGRRGPKAFITTEHDHRREVGSCPVSLDEQASPTSTLVLPLALLPGGDEYFDIARRNTLGVKTDGSRAAPASS